MSKKIKVFHRLDKLEAACQGAPSSLFGFEMSSDLGWYDDVDSFDEADLHALLTSPSIHQLCSLSLTDLGFDHRAVRLLAEQGTLHQLRHLVLCDDAALNLTTMRALTTLDMPALEVLDLSHVSMTGEMLRVLFSWPQCQHLKSLNLSNCGLGAQQLVQLADLQGVFAFDVLDLTSNEMGDDGLVQLAKSPVLSGVKTLKLGGDAYGGTNALGDDGLVALAQSPHVKGLEVLDLGGNAIGNRGVEALAKAPWMATVRGLDLSSNEIGDVGVYALAGSSYVMSIKALKLGHNPLTDKGLAALERASGMTRLARLSVIWTKVSEQQVRQIKTSSNLDEVEYGDLWYSGDNQSFEVDD